MVIIMTVELKLLHTRRHQHQRLPQRVILKNNLLFKGELSYGKYTDYLGRYTEKPA